jgi:PAS domain S-box-containing protein
MSSCRNGNDNFRAETPYAIPCKQGRRDVDYRPIAPGLVGSSLLPVVAFALAIGIFIIDTLTPLGIAVAVLYVVVLFIAATFLERRGLLIVAIICVALTILSYVLTHGHSYGSALARGVLSLAAIGVTTVLILKNQSTSLVLREQAGLLDVTHDAVFVRDMKDCVTYWNRGAGELYGWTAEEAVGRTSHQLLRTEFSHPLEAIMAELLRNDRWEGELVHKTRDGQLVTVASRWSLQRDANRQPVAILETNNDITEQRRFEEKTRQQEKELRLAIDTIPTMAWLTLPDGSAEYLNKRWLDYTGLTLEEARDWNWQVAIHPDDLPALRDTWIAHVATGEPVELEARLRRFDGQHRWFLFRGEPLRDDSGNIVRWYGTNTDIEERKRAETALRRSEAYLAEAQRLSVTGSFGWNIATDEIYWSDETYRIFEYSADRQPTLDVVRERTHPDDLARVEALLERVRHDTKQWQFEHRLLMPGGAVKHLRVVAHAADEATGQPTFLGAIMDISASREAENQLQEARTELAHVNRVTTLGELAASIAHEVNQPIAAVVTNASAGLRWLAATPPNLDEVRNALGRIVKDGERAGEVLGRIRSLVKKTPMRQEQLDINETILEVVALTRSEVQRNSVVLRTELSPSLPKLPGDRVQLQQVILNLIVNAVEAMSSGAAARRELTITSATEAANGVLVSVRDSGPGIDAQCLDRLFDPFYTTKTDGLGMGLAISHSLIEAHGGRLWAASKEGQGATFHFSLPYEHDGDA